MTLQLRGGRGMAGGGAAGGGVRVRPAVGRGLGRPRAPRRLLRLPRRRRRPTPRPALRPARARPGWKGLISSRWPCSRPSSLAPSGRQVWLYPTEPAAAAPTYWARRGVGGHWLWRRCLDAVSQETRGDPPLDQGTGGALRRLRCLGAARLARRKQGLAGSRGSTARTEDSRRWRIEVNKVTKT